MILILNIFNFIKNNKYLIILITFISLFIVLGFYFINLNNTINILKEDNKKLKLSNDYLLVSFNIKESLIKVSNIYYTNVYNYISNYNEFLLDSNTVFILSNINISFYESFK